MSDKTHLSEEFFARFLAKNNLPSDTSYADIYYFDFTKESADYLAELVRMGKKCGTTSLYIPGDYTTQVAEYDIITDFEGNPKAVVQVTEILIIPFKDMTFDIAVLEGEDEIFDTWLKNHIAFLGEDAKNHNIEFNDDTLIAFEKFRLVYKE